MLERDSHLKFLALIPARGGSKRLPDKNILPLAGKPLIAWTIDAAKLVFAPEEIVVSTDSDKIAEVARAHGATVPWLRPAALATDTASSVDVALHALDWHEQRHGPVDGIVLLQPTSPFRQAAMMTQLIAQFVANGRRPVVSVSPVATHPLWAFKVGDGRMTPYVDNGGVGKRSQDLPPAYCLNGSLYLISPEQLRAQRSFVTDDAEPLIVDDPLCGLDIDTEFDFAYAQMMVMRART